MSKSYQTTITVHFGDVDPARIVYYPIIFHYCHVAFENFWAEFVGIPYAKLLTEKQIGFPAVNAQANFSRPVKYGDTVKIKVSVTRIGKSSVEFRYQAFNELAQDYFVAEIKVVAVDMQTFLPIVLPAEYAEIFAQCRDCQHGSQELE